MSPADILDVARDGILTVILVSAPLMVVGLVVGVIVSLIQALTQIQEQTLVFVPKILAIFATMIIASHRVFRRARQHPANRGWFDRFSPATLSDFVPHLVVIATLVLLGAWLWRSGSTGWPALCALLATILVLGYEIFNAAKFWNQSMDDGNTAASPDG